MSQTEQTRAIAKMQIDSADHFTLYTRVGNKLHTAGDLNLNDIAICLINQAQALGVSRSVVIEQITACVNQVYGSISEGN